MSLAGWPDTKKQRMILDSSLTDTDESEFPVRIRVHSRIAEGLFEDVEDSYTQIAIELGDTGEQCYIEVPPWRWNLDISYGEYPPAYNSTYVKATTYLNAGYAPYLATNPEKPVSTGWAVGNWLTTVGTITNQKFNIDLGEAKVVSNILLHNSHSTGTATDSGIKNFILYGTNSSTAFNNTTYTDTTDLTELGTYQAAEHIAVDASDPQYFPIVDNTVAYRYYVLRIADNWGHTNYMGIRHIELGEKGKEGTIYAKMSEFTADVDPQLNLYWDSEHGHNIEYVCQTGGVTETLLGPYTPDGDGGTTGTNRRIVVDSSQLIPGKGPLQIEFLHNGTDYGLDNCWVYKKAATGEIYDGETDSGVQVSLGGSTSFTVTATAFTSDVFGFHIEDGDSLVIAFYPSAGSTARLSTLPTNCTAYYKTGSSESNFSNVAADYTSETYWMAIKKIIGTPITILKPLTVSGINGASGLNLRMVLDPSHLTITSAGALQFEFFHSGTDYGITSCFVYKQAETGDAWDGDPDTGAEVTMGGNNTFTVTSTDKISDPVHMRLLDTDTLVFAFYGTTGPIAYGTAVPTSCGTYYKSAADESDTADVTGYTSLGTWKLIQAIRVLHPSHLVWTNDFNSVYHPQDPTRGVGTYLDSTIGSNHGKTVGDMTWDDYEDNYFIGPALDCDPTDYVSLPHTNLGSYVSAEMFVKRQSGAHDIISKHNAANENSYHLTYNYDNKFQFAVYDTATTYGNALSDVDSYTHAYIAGTYDGTTIRLYKDGTEVATDASISGTVFVGNSTHQMNRKHYGPISGTIFMGDARISDVGRSAGYVALTSASYYDTLISWQDTGLADWDQSKKIKILLDSTPISSDQIDFPVRVHITEPALFTDITSNYKKIAIGIGDTTSQCYIEVLQDEWDYANNSGVIYVRVPIYSASEDTELRLYWDSSHADNDEFVGATSDTPSDLFGPLTSNDHAGTASTNRRMVLDSSQLSVTNNGHFIIEFLHNGTDYGLDSCWVYKKAATGDAWDGEAGSGVEVTLDGDSTFTITATEKSSDPIEMDIGTGESLVIAFYPTTGPTARPASIPTSCGSYYSTTTDESSTADVASYTTDTYWMAIEGILSIPSGRLVWTNGFTNVYHPQDPSGGADTYLDSTTHGRHGTPSGAMTSGDLIDGVVGPVVNYDGSNDYILCPSYTPSPYLTAEGIIYEVNVTEDGLLGKDDTSWGRSYQMWKVAGKLRAIAFTDNSTYGTATSTADLPASGHVSMTFDGTTVKGFINGVQDGSASLSGTLNQTPDTVTTVGLVKGGFWSYLNGSLGEVRISNVARSADWLLLTTKSLNDDLVTFTNFLVWFDVSNYVDVTFKYAVEVENYIDVYWGGNILTYVDVINDPAEQVMNFVDVSMQYVYQPLNVIDEEWNSAPYLAVNAVDVTYNILGAVTNFVDELYTMTGVFVENYVDVSYDLEAVNRPINVIDEPYSLLSGEGIETQSIVEVYLESAPDVWNPIRFTEINIENSMDSFGLVGSLTLSSKSDYLEIQHLDNILASIDGTDFIMFAEIPAKRETNSAVNYTIKILSPTAKLEAPYADRITESFSSSIDVLSYITSLAAIEGISVEWNMPIPSWSIPSTDLIVNDETPMAVIVKLVSAAKGIVQTNPDGNISIISYYPVAFNRIDDAVPDHVLTVTSDLKSISETLVIKEGFNAFLIDNSTGTSESISIEEVQLDSTRKLIKGFRIPFDDGPFDLETSGGSEISLDRQQYPITQTVPDPTEEDAEYWEIVEFIDRVGTTSKPIYGDIIAWDWIQDDLGSNLNDPTQFTIEEDGTITALDESRPTESLLRIRYSTKYWAWIMTGPENIEIQVYVPELEE